LFKKKVPLCEFFKGLYKYLPIVSSAAMQDAQISSGLFFAVRSPFSQQVFKWYFKQASCDLAANMQKKTVILCSQQSKLLQQNFSKQFFQARRNKHCFQEPFTT
jgi:hypothetical protein